MKVPSIGVGGGGIMDVFWNYTLQFTHITAQTTLSCESGNKINMFLW